MIADLTELRRIYVDPAEGLVAPDPLLVALFNEHERLRAELADFTGTDWAAEEQAHTAFIVAENRGGGLVTCPDCGRGAFVDGAADIDLSPRRCFSCEHKAAIAELTELRALQADQQRAFAFVDRIAALHASPGIYAEGEAVKWALGDLDLLAEVAENVTAALSADAVRLTSVEDAARELLRDLNESLDGCLICGDEDGHTDDCTAAALTALLETAYARVSPKASHPDGHDAAWCACAECYQWRASLAPRPSPRRVPGRPAGQRIAEEPTAEAREVGLDRERAALLSDYHDDATALLDGILAKAGIDSSERGEEFHEEHAEIVEALADAHANGRGSIWDDGCPGCRGDLAGIVDRVCANCRGQLAEATGEGAPRVDTTVPDETIQAVRRYFVHDGDGYDSSYTSPDEARKAAETALDRWKADARDNDGWADEVRSVAWGEVIECAEEVPDEHAEDDEERGVDYRLTNCRVPVAPKES